jgi:hypothetical protein
MTNFYFLDTTDGTAEIIPATTEMDAWMKLCDIYGTEYTADNIIRVEKF